MKVGHTYPTFDREYPYEQRWISKRYPKKDSDSKSNNPVRCVKISMGYFDEEEKGAKYIRMKIQF